MKQNLLRLLAWATLAAIVLATLSPIGDRPRLPMPVDVERAGAFFLAGLLMALAYPRRVWWLLFILLVAVIGLEWSQMLRPDRHGRIEDGAVKAAGTVLGLACGWLMGRIGRR